MCFLSPSDYGYDEDEDTTEDNYGTDDYGTDDYGSDEGYPDYETETEPTDPDYNTDYGNGGTGEIETNTNSTFNCSTCFIPVRSYCSWVSGFGGSLRFPSFMRLYQKPLLAFGGWGSMTNRYRNWSSQSFNSGRSLWDSSGRWNGNLGNNWQANRWMGSNSCMLSGSTCGGGFSRVAPPCSQCTSGNIWQGNGWVQRATSSQRLVGTGKGRGRGVGGWRGRGLQGSKGWGSRNGGFGGGGSFSNILNRFSNQWSQNNRFTMPRGSSNGRGCVTCGNTNRLTSGLGIFSSWFG